jgi:4,5-DOPA dioxygenase extradiol
MATLKDLRKLSDTLDPAESKTPLLFLGHGSPMNGIEDNSFSHTWETLGKEIQPPQAVLCISAHWYTKGTHITAMEKPKTIHDFYGFPTALFEVQYPAPGHPELAQETASMIHSTQVGLDHEWGLDHGTWSVVRRMYPQANVPVLQLSIDHTKPPPYHYDLAREISALRKKGVLIIGSGNMVHNLRMEMNEKFKSQILKNDHTALIQYEKLGREALLSIPTPEHYLPLLYILGLKEKDEPITFYNDKITMGSVSMTSVRVG